MSRSDYEMVIGLEVHAELKTQTKIFCGCSTAFGAPPNTQCCPVCTGMPGSLPVLNRKVAEYAVMAGLATHCRIASYSKEDRKNYFYPDLPKAYQISQYDLPLCEQGYLDIETAAGEKRIGITRIHIEEDAGKLLHMPDGSTLCDYNRCGVPLIEIVSEPDIRSGEEAVAYLKKLRSVLLYTGVSDCKMQEGSLRCDVNLSVRPKGEANFGVRAEMKNLNSFQFIEKAIAYEFQRQVDALESGETLVQETRRFDQTTGKTYTMRRKEEADDYRYFPDPDLIPIAFSPETIEVLSARIPRLPEQRQAEYREKYGLSNQLAGLLTEDKAAADYFEAAAQKTGFPVLLANLFAAQILPQWKEGSAFPLPPDTLARVAELTGQERLNSGNAKRLIQELWEKDDDPDEKADALDLWQISEESILLPIVQETLAQNEKAAADYKKGKKQALQAIAGQVIRKTEGRGNPTVIRTLLEKELQAE